MTPLRVTPAWVGPIRRAGRDAQVGGSFAAERPPVQAFRDGASHGGDARRASGTDLAIWSRVGSRHLVAPILLGLAIGFVAAPTVQALSISAPTVALSAANSADVLTTGGANRVQIASAVSVLGAPSGAPLAGAGASDGFATRFAALLALDREAGGGSSTRSATAGYSITFSVDNPTGAPFVLSIDSSRIGTIALVDDGSGNASATLGGVTGLLNGVADPALGLAGVAPLTSAATASAGVAQTGSTWTLASSAVGTQVFTLDFTWNASVTSARNEAAIRLGLPGGLGTTTADDSPGPLSASGHFVQVNLTLVPEPSALLLLGSGVFALALKRRRKE